MKYGGSIPLQGNEWIWEFLKKFWIRLLSSVRAIGPWRAFGAQKMDRTQFVHPNPIRQDSSVGRVVVWKTIGHQFKSGSWQFWKGSHGLNRRRLTVGSRLLSAQPRRLTTIEFLARYLKDCYCLVLKCSGLRPSYLPNGILIIICIRILHFIIWNSKTLLYNWGFARGAPWGLARN